MEEINFEKWFVENFRPCCYVYSTESAKTIIQKNNLTPSEFLRPFADFTGKTIFFPRETDITEIDDFLVDCYDSDNLNNCQNIPPDKINDYLIKVLSNPSIYPEWSLHDNKIIKKSDLSNIILSKLKKNCFPWMNHIERTYFECLQFSSTEMYQQPLFNVLMCSTLEDPQCLNETAKEKMKPFLIKRGIYEDSNIIILILLNDNSDERTSTIKKSTVQTDFQNKYNFVNVKLWDVNTSKDEDSKSKDIWSKYFHNIDKYNPNYKRNNETVYGKLITPQEQETFRNSFFSFFSEHVATLIQGEIPKLEAKINDLKGGWFFSNKNDSKMEFVTELNIYKMKEVDKYRITLGMIYFYFRNYESVLDLFKRIDIKIRTNEFYVPFINHIISICNHMLTNGKYIKVEYDKSYNEFLRSSSYAQAFQSMFIMIKMLENFKMFEDIRIMIFDKNSKLKNNRIKVPHFDKIHSCLTPIWIEKAGLSYITNKNYYRKFFLSMFQAGETYCNIENPIHHRYIINSYGWLFSFFDNVAFSFIRLKDYLNHVMGNSCMAIEYYEAANRFFKNTLELAKYNFLPTTNQKKYLNCFLSTLENYYSQKGNRLGIINSSSLSIPEISNTTVSIVEEQDYVIENTIQREEAMKHQPWTKLCKYSYVQLKKAYANLSDNDLVILRVLDDILTLKKGCCNLYSRRHFQGKVNEKIHISFEIKNPLKTDLNIMSLELICDFRPEENKDEDQNIIEDSTTPKKELIEYETISLFLPPNNKKTVELYFKPLVPGHCIIKGVTIKLSSVAIINHFFNQKNLSKLYSYRTRIASIPSEFGRRSTISSQNSNMVQETIVKKKIVLNRKADLIYDVLTDSSDILIHFPQGQDFEMYQHELRMIPIIIINNSSHKIKRFSIFTLDSNNYLSSPHSYLCENIYKEIELFKNNKQIELYIPFVPLFIKQYYLKILIKFEEESIAKQIDVRRFALSIKAKPSVKFVFNEERFNMDTISNLNTKTYFSIMTLAFIEDKESLREFSIGSVIHNNQFSVTNDIKWNPFLKDSNDKLYSNINCTKTTSNNPRYFIKDNIIDSLPEDINATQPHIKKKFFQLFVNDIFLFNWTAIDKDDKVINGLFAYKPTLSLPKLTESFLQILVTHSITFNVNQHKISGNDTITIVTIDILFNKKSFLEIKSIKEYKFSPKRANQDFNWFGLKKHIIKNAYDNNESSEVKMSFSFMTKLKGEMNVNKIQMKFYDYKAKNYNYILRDAPYPVIVFIK